jgi:tetratricopeptide (TPR) repeat protein
MSGERAGLLLRLALPVALLTGVLLRAEYLRELIATPFWDNFVLDSEWYDQAAHHLLQGRTLAEGEILFRGPLYPWFLASMYQVFGAGPLAPRLVQGLLGLLLAGVCWRIARRTHGEDVAALTAGLAATFGMFIYFEGEILGTTLCTLLVAAGTLLLLEGDARDSLRRLAGGGLALGLAWTVHPLALVLAPAAVLWVALRGRRFLPTAAVVTGLLLPVGLVTAHNFASTGQVVPVAAQGGINLYIGNNPHADGKSALAPGFAEPEQVLHEGDYRDNVAVAARTLAERDAGRPLSVAEVDRYWYGQAFRWMRDHPKDALILFARKLVFFWNGFEISNTRDLIDQARRFTPILSVFLVQYSFLLPFALFGLLREGVRGRERRLLAWFLVSWTIGVCAFFVSSRFRVPAVPWLLPFSAAGVIGFLEDVRHARTARRGFGRAVALLVFLFAATNGLLVSRAGIADVTVQRDAPFHRFNLAVVFEREGNLDRAISEYRAAQATRLSDPRVHLNLGNLLARTGRGGEAREEYHKVLRIDPTYESAVRHNLAILASQEGDWDEAIRQFEGALAADPDSPGALLGLATAYLSAGRLDESLVAHRRALADSAGPEGAIRRSLAVTYLEMGLLEDAEREALISLQLDPKDVVAVLTLGKIYTLRAAPEAAALMWEKARTLAPGMPLVERAIEDARGAAPP